MTKSHKSGIPLPIILGLILVWTSIPGVLAQQGSMGGRMGGGMEDDGGGMPGGAIGGGMGRSKGGPPPGPPRKMGPPRTGRLENSEFDGAMFTCLNYINSASENATNNVRATFARLWIEGNLAGYYKAQDKLIFSDDVADRQALRDTFYESCAKFPSVSVQTVGLQGMSRAEMKLPRKLIGDIEIDSYTCGQHIEGKSGDAAGTVRADIAEMWAFAFIQGYNAARNSEVIIPSENKPTLMSAILKNCNDNKEMMFLTLTSNIAQKVKIK